MYALKVSGEADTIFFKLAKKNKTRLEMINKKIQEIRENPQHTYKYLKQPLQGYNRTHIDSCFVLIFRVDHSIKRIEVCYFDHHDNIYKWRPKPE
jgi:YafQ family addiction module toxin component